MPIAMRPFGGPADFGEVSGFLTRLYQPRNADGCWFQPIWEYAYTHPWFDDASLDRIGLWEDGDRLVAVATYELRLGEAFINLDPGYPQLKPALLDHAEAALRAVEPDGSAWLKVFVDGHDAELAALVTARGYQREPGSDRPMAQFDIPQPFPLVPVPEGFRLFSLADDNDLARFDRLLHRGFNHPGEPPADGVVGRRRMQSGPNYRHDLAIVVAAPSGDWAAFCGMWHDPVNRFGYVEPVCTDPTYRRQGCGRAVVLEGIRRCGELGATVAYVGSLKPFYRSLGFRQVGEQACWVRRWAA